MTNDAANEPPQRIWWRRSMIVGVIVLALAVAATDAVRRERHRRWLIAEIEAAGGSVRIDQDAWHQVRWLLNHRDHERPVAMASLAGPRIDNQWLQRHDYLAGLSLRTLWLDESHFSADELAHLIAAHPVEDLYAPRCPLSESLLAAFERSTTLRQINVQGSDLTDDGLRQLPLQKCDYLDVANTMVTPSGLQQLQRCERLEILTLDATQLNGDVVKLLADQGTVRLLTLLGSGFTDAQMKSLESLQTLEGLTLDGSGASPEARESFEQALPGCQLECDDRHLLAP